MHPVIFKFGSVTVYSYGFMLVLAFIAAYYFFLLEIRRKKIQEQAALDITIIALFCGVGGSKLLYILENLDRFFADPAKIAFSTGGFTFLGGLILSFIVSWIYVRIKKINFLRAADAVSPSLILAYGIGRIGCHLAGDGDYGIPTSLPWGVNYENGIVPPSAIFKGTDYAAAFQNGILPDNTPLHPTPVYEFIAAVLIFLFLWKFRTKIKRDGEILVLYLMLSSASRFLVEFIRLNPPLLSGLTEAQLISFVVFIIGAAGYLLIPFPAGTKIKK